MSTIFKTPFTESDKTLLKTSFQTKDAIFAYPTETFYALGCRADSDEAVKKIYTIKKRDPSRPLLVLVNSWEQFFRFALAETNAHLETLKTIWPGPLTAIFPAKPGLSPFLNKVGANLAFRMTADETARTLIDLAGAPLAGTSANLSGDEETRLPETTWNFFKDKVDLIVDGGITPGGNPTTLVDLSDPDRVRILRQGKLKWP